LTAGPENGIVPRQFAIRARKCVSGSVYTSGKERRKPNLDGNALLGDPNPRNTTKRLENRVLALARNGIIIIMHVNGGGISTAQALPDIVDALRRREFAFVLVGDLLKHEDAQ
jgi:peptidoglycan/xylan/chitin deacetylase (PgdA/CDA1 family)